MSAGIRPIGANATGNQECLATGEYYPDRTLTPLVLQPFCGYTDANSGEHVDDAMPMVTNGCWYRLDDSNRHLGICPATAIDFSTTGTDSAGNQITVFSVVSTPGSADYGRLTIRENVPPGEDITYIFAATLSVDGRPILERYNSRCDSIAEIPDIVFDNNSTALYNPLDDPQYFSINPSLTIDYPVVWKWMSYHELEGGWVTLGTTQLDWSVEKVGNGIRIDRKRMPDMIMLRCIAELTIDGTTVTVEAIVTHTRMMPHWEERITRVGEIPNDVDSISPYAEISTAGEPITDLSELSVEWLNSNGAVVGEGINPTIRISSLGADGVVYLRVRDRGGFAALVDDGKLIVDDNALIITRSK